MQSWNPSAKELNFRNLLIWIKSNMIGIFKFNMTKKIRQSSQVWWSTPVISYLGGRGKRISPRTTWAKAWDRISTKALRSMAQW
jgi:hypothetical protein